MAGKKAPWNKGFNKFNHPSIQKISCTLAAKPRSNFYFWQIKHRSKYRAIEKNKDLAELLGVILGDGNIEVFPRTERLTVSCNSKNRGFINRYKDIIEKIFGKKVKCTKFKNSNCVRISIYQKLISERMGIPTGNRNKLKFKIPEWILKNKKFLICYLRGLFEAEGSFCVHKPTGTYKLFFCNQNKSLLENVYSSLILLGFHPNKSGYKIQISKKEEIYKAKNLIKFRQYCNTCGVV